MSTITTAYDDALRTLLPLLEDGINHMQETVKAQVESCAHIGSLIVGGCNAGHKTDKWAWLQSLCPTVREAHIRVCLTAYSRQQSGRLADMSQMAFALSNGDSSPTDETAKAESSGGSDIADQINLLSRAWAGLNRMQRQPLDKWDAAVRRGMKEHLRPFVELYNKL